MDRIDHICLAVRSIADTREKICCILGYKPKTNIVKNTRQDVLVQFLTLDGDSIDLKLIQPASPQSGLVNFLKSRGEGLHHICYKG